ncbi:NAD(P)/FAD-dependent oxidoreductase [bacterium]|nr:NAD(P)/FAD-dependent oxidoreductase [bacterium]
MINRRNFLKGLGLLGLSPTIFSQENKSNIKLSLYEPEMKLGHQLRDPQLIQKALKNTKDVLHTDVLIAGGGIGGLNCARLLQKDQRDFLVLDPANEMGGTSASMSYLNRSLPSGAHYVVTANPYAQDLLDFYLESNIITVYDQNLAQYNQDLIIEDIDSKERSLYLDQWTHEIGEYLEEPSTILKKFHSFCRFLSTFKGDDGKLWFALPSQFSSKDKKALDLFQIDFVTYLKDNDMWDSEVEYVVNYAAMDDYGCLADQCSAWVGFHYFASRNQYQSHYTLSSSQGNGFLVEALTKNIEAKKLCNQSMLLYSVPEGTKHKSLIFKNNQFYFVYSKHLVFAGKSHAIPYIFPKADPSFIQEIRAKKQVPWLVTQLAFQIPEGFPLSYLCWDNVRKDSDSVGYIASNYFQKEFKNPLILTHFFPTAAYAKLSAKDLYHLSKEQLKSLVLNDFESISPELLPFLKSMCFKRIGHAMALCPKSYVLPSLSNKKYQSNTPILANCDSYGLPLFEEAFQAGVNAYHAIS